MKILLKEIHNPLLWLVPVGMIVTPVFGWLSLWAQEHWHLSNSLSVSLYGTSMLVSLLVISLWGTWLVDRLDLRYRSERPTARELTAREEAIRRLEASEQKLAASEQRFRGIFNSTFNFIGLLAPDGTVLEANKTALDLIGAQLEDVLGRSFVDTPWWAYSAAEREKLRAGIERATRGETVRFETIHPQDHGGLRHVDFTLKPVLDSAGRVVHLVPEGRDITERKQAAEALRTSMEEFRTLAEAMPQIVWITRPDGWNIYFNQQWMDYTGLTIEESLGHGWNKPFHPDDQQRAWNAWQSATTKFTTYSLECRLRRADGVYRWWLIRGQPLRDSQGQVIKWFGTCTDIHDLKLAEARSRESEERFRGAFENSAIGMALVSLEGRFIRVNRALCQIVGRMEEELLACTFHDITHAEDRDTDLVQMRVLLAGEIDHYQMEKRYLHWDGHVVWVLLTATVVRTANGDPVHFVAQIEDITERHEGARRVQASLEEKEVLLREVHHRVKNNMQVITSMLQLQSSYLTDPRDAAIFKECQARIHAMSLVHDRLYRSGNFATIDFSEHLRELTTLIVRGQAGDAPRIRVVLESEPVPVNLDTAIPLGLIAAELITNSYKHAFRDRPGGTITVRLARAAERLTLTVEDDGIGLPVGFEPEQARSLGLRLVRALSQQLRAELSIESPAIGSKVAIKFSI